MHGEGMGALTLMLPFETTKQNRQTDRQEYYTGARAQGAELGTALSTPQCWESTALPHTPHTPRAPPVQPVLEVTPSPL